MSVPSTSSIQFQSRSNDGTLEKSVKGLDGLEGTSLTSTNTINHGIDNTILVRHFNNDEPKDNSETQNLFVDAVRNTTRATYYHLKRIHRNDWKGLAIAVFCNTAGKSFVKI